jgi:hypothetical protein
MTTLISAENSRYTWMRLGLGWDVQKRNPEGPAVEPQAREASFLE